MSETNNGLDPFLDELAKLELRNVEERRKAEERYHEQTAKIFELFRRTAKSIDRKRETVTNSYTTYSMKFWWGTHEDLSDSEVDTLSSEMLDLIAKGEVFDSIMKLIKEDDELETLWDQLCLMAKLKGPM